MAHTHSHQQMFGRAFAIGIVLNSLYVVTEAIIGIRIGSLGLIADAGHNASDVLSLIIAWVGQHLATRPPGKQFTYGLKRSPIVGSLFNALLLFAAMGIVAWEAIGRLQHPSSLPGSVIIWVSLVGLVINFGTAVLFMRGRHDLNIRGAFLHMMADGLVTLGVLLGGIAIVITGVTWLDPIISLLIVGVVLWSTWGLFKDALRLSLDAIPATINPDEVRAYLRSLPGVTSVHDLHIWAMSTTETALTAHLVIPDKKNVNNQLLKNASQALHERFDIIHTTLQLESGLPENPCGLVSGDVV